MKNLFKMSRSLLLILCLLMMAALLTSSALAQEAEATNADVQGPVVIGTVLPDAEATQPPVPGTVIINNIPDGNSSDDSSDNESAPTSPIYYLIVVVMAVLLIGYMIFGTYISQLLAKYVPPETAASIYQSGVRLGLEVGLNKAGQTPSKLDDEFFEGLAVQRGMAFTKTENADGTFTYTVTTPVRATSAG